MTGSNRDVLSSFDLIRDRTGRDLTAKARFPKERSGARVEGVEVTFASAGEEEVRRSGQYSAVRYIGHRKPPLLISRVGVERNDSAMSCSLGPCVYRTSLQSRNILSAWNRTRG